MVQGADSHLGMKTNRAEGRYQERLKSLKGDISHTLQISSSNFIVYRHSSMFCKENVCSHVVLLLCFIYLDITLKLALEGEMLKAERPTCTAIMVRDKKPSQDRGASNSSRVRKDEI